tara:strand:- start:12645 stop:14126 length:1482 start_codon:yes stop_codon:yes gene_type:complete
MSMLTAIKKATAIESEAPLPLVREKLPAPDYPLVALGETLGKAATSIADCVQCSPAMAGQSVLSAASLAVQAFADIIIDGRIYPLSLFCLTIAESGDRKSAADTLALKAHYELQKEWLSEHRKEKATYSNELDAYDIEIKKTKGKKALAQSELADELNKIIKPLVPVVPSLIAQEPTLEGLQKSFDIGRSSQGLFNDEGGQFFGGHAMSNDNALKSMAGLSKFWDGKEIIRTRAAEDENLSLYGKRLCVHLMVQPIVANKVLSDPILQGQGFLPRFLLSWPESIAGTRLYNYKDATQEPSLIHYWGVIRELLSKPLPDENIPPRVIPLTPEAKEHWVISYDIIEGNLCKGGELIGIKATASKAAENIIRIAGVLALIENIEADQIELNHIEKAVILGQYYLSEALRLNEGEPKDTNLESAQLLLDWLKEQESTFFSLRMICRNGPRASGVRSGKATAQKIINTLVEYGWVVRLPEGMTIDDKFCCDVWRLKNV